MSRVRFIFSVMIFSIVLVDPSYAWEIRKFNVQSFQYLDRGFVTVTIDLEDTPPPKIINCILSNRNGEALAEIGDYLWKRITSINEQVFHAKEITNISCNIRNIY